MYIFGKMLFSTDIVHKCVFGNITACTHCLVQWFSNWALQCSNPKALASASIRAGERGMWSSRSCFFGGVQGLPFTHHKLSRLPGTKGATHTPHKPLQGFQKCRNSQNNEPDPLPVLWSQTRSELWSLFWQICALGSPVNAHLAFLSPLGAICSLWWVKKRPCTPPKPGDHVAVFTPFLQQFTAAVKLWVHLRTTGFVYTAFPAVCSCTVGPQYLLWYLSVTVPKGYWILQPSYA